MNKRLLAVLASGAWLYAASAFAIDDIRFNGFFTAGATYADKQLLPDTQAVSEDGGEAHRPTMNHETRFGLQINAKVNPQISATAQLFAGGHSEGEGVSADWSFLTYRVSDQLSVRAGKLKLSAYLVSDYRDVGYAYPWVHLPEEVYYSNPLEAINGVDMLARFNFGGYSLLIQPYAGQTRESEALVPQEVSQAFPLCSGLTSGPPAPPPYPVGVSPCAAGEIVHTSFDTDRLRGINFSFGSDAFTLRAGYLKTLVTAPDFGVLDDVATFSSAGMTMDWNNVVVYAEAFQRKITGTANMAFPNQKGSYLTLGYRFGRWLPHVTGSKLDDNNNPSTSILLTGNPADGYNGIPLKQESLTLGLRYELGAGAALKLEAREVTPEKGTRGLLIAAPTAAAEPSDSVRIYGIAVETVF